VNASEILGACGMKFLGKDPEGEGVDCGGVQEQPEGCR
jgi:hypothetical protein